MRAKSRFERGKEEVPDKGELRNSVRGDSRAREDMSNGFNGVRAESLFKWHFLLCQVLPEVSFGYVELCRDLFGPPCQTRLVFAKKSCYILALEPCLAISAFNGQRQEKMDSTAIFVNDESQEWRCWLLPVKRL